MLALALCGSNISGQVNSWTKITNGYWEEPFWSLGVLPSSGQSAIQFTNGGYKALAIGPSTRTQYPQTLTISNLEVSAPANSGNLLLMNYSGLEVPLRVLNNFHIGANGHLLHLYALLRIEGLNGGGFFVDGIARHAEFASLIANRVVIGSEWIGEYHLTNGTFTTSNLIVGVGAPGTFTQSGGVVEITSELALGPNTFAGPASARGDYWLHGGMLFVPVLDGRRGTFTQLAGTNRTGTLHLVDATYELLGGSLISGNLDLFLPTPATGMASLFVQRGGNHQCAGGINLGNSSGNHGAEYQLDAGQLSASSARITWWSSFIQNGATNSLGYLQLDQPDAQYHLNGGLLATERCRVGVFGYPEPELPSIIQNGGVHRVSDQLILEEGAYLLKGGTLTASNIIVGLGELRLQGGAVIHSGKVEMEGGILAPEQGTTTFGPLVLSTNLGAFGSRHIDFSNAPATIHFADSSGPLWPTSAVLSVRNWAGSLHGGGKHQTRFGNNASGLSAQQLLQVRFSNPGGLPSGNYTARLLPDGEAVPDSLDLRGFLYVTNNRSITITKYECLESVVIIPSIINGLPVAAIGDNAFNGCTGLRIVIIPDTVTSIGFGAFQNCSALTEVVIGNGVTSIGGRAFAYCANLKSVTIPDSVTAIWGYAFQYCYNLTNAIIGDGLTNIAFGAFSDCTSLKALHFRGHAPRIDIVVFTPVGNVTVFYLPGTLGWASEFAGAPTALWRLPYPVILHLPPSFGVQADRFGFITSWATNASVVIEACTSLANPVWAPLATNTLGTAGWSFFGDPNWRNYPNRFYRLRQF